MASRAESRVVNLAGLVQGITLVTVPAASSIFTGLLFAAIVRWLPARVVFHLLPIVLVATFLLITALPEDAPWLGVAAFGLALLPLTISLGQDALTTMSTAVAGGVIAFYQVGYGIAAFGVGPIVDSGTSLSTIYGWNAIAAAGLALLSFAVTRRQPSPQLATPPG